MHVRRTRYSLVASALVCGIGAVGALAWGSFSPIAVALTSGPSIKRRSTTASPNGATIDGLALESFTTLWGKRLQKPLREDAAGTEAAARTAAQAAQQKAALAFVLVGTMIESEGFSRAMFSVPPGNVELRGVGESVGVPPANAEVVVIERNQVVVRYQGRLVTLRLKGADEG